jgi:TolB-like protein/class 3 adenylate cyclase/Tfp pilus assembly protein PilF
MSSSEGKQRLAAILAADVAGYSRLMTADERRTVASLDAARAIFRCEIEGRLGRVVDMAGDSVLAVFESAAEAVNAALAVQKQLTAHSAAVSDEQRMRFRIGVHLGDVIEKADGTVYGAGVNMAARLEALAEPGGIAVSDAVHGVVRGRVAARFEDQGERAVKNIPHPVRTYYVRDDASAVSGPIEAAPEPGRALPERPAIAVLPFANMSGDPEQEYFADGMVEDIITALSRFKELFVIARNSSFVYKGRAVDIQQVARDLGVRYVLEGSVRKAGNRVRITGQLIDAATRAHLWADRFDGALDDVFDLQDRITESVIGALLPTLRRAEIERARRKPPASLDAYDHLLRALPAVIANTRAEAGTAIKRLDEALRLYPDYAYAHALIATAYGQIYRSAAGSEREEMRAQAVAHARRAVALGGDDSAALAPAGFMLLVAAQDVAGARAALDKAVALNPNSAAALTYHALLLAIAGEPEPAIEDAKRALCLSPLDSAIYLPQMAIVIARIRLRHYDEAVLWARKAIEVNPHYPMSYAWLIVAECARGNAAEAERQVKRLADILPGFEPGTLARLFDVFPDPLRSNSVAMLRDAGLVPAAS